MQWWVAGRVRAYQNWPPIAPNSITIHTNKKVMQCARAKSVHYLTVVNS